MTTATPDMRDYQQLVYGGKTGPVDCAGWAGAICCHAHTKGATRVTGRQIRLASNEPIPDVGSPGLNVSQVDAAVYKLTSGRVNFDTPLPGSLGRVGVRDRVIDGQWVHLAVNRGVLVSRGYGGSSGFRGSHAITGHIRATDLMFIDGDPLVPYFYAVPWDVVIDAAQAVTNSGDIFCSFTRDLTLDWAVVVRPRAGADTRVFYRYFLTNGKIVKRERHRTEGFTATCTPPRLHTGTLTRELVQLTSGRRKGWWISATYARQK